MNKDSLIAYGMTLGSLVSVFVAALIAACLVPEVMGKMEIFGLGTITGGLIGVLKQPSPPTAKTDTGDVNLSK